MCSETRIEMRTEHHEIAIHGPSAGPIHHGSIQDQQPAAGLCVARVCVVRVLVLLP